MVALKTLLRNHDAELRAFRRQLFSEAADSSAWIGSSAGVDEAPRLARFGPVRSTTNRHADLTIVGDMVDQAVMMEDADLSGTILTLSVAAHHRMLGSRLPVDDEDAVVWVRAILGEEWAAHAYAGGALSTTSNADSPGPSRLTTQFFYVFISREGKPQAVPAAFRISVRPLAELA